MTDRAQSADFLAPREQERWTQRSRPGTERSGAVWRADEDFAVLATDHMPLLVHALHRTPAAVAKRRRWLERQEGPR